MARRGQNRSVLGVVITHFVAEASPHPQSRGPPWLRRASADPISAGAAFSDIALSIRYVQLTSSIAQQAQQMSAVLLIKRAKRFCRTLGGTLTALFAPQIHPHFETGPGPQVVF